MFVNIIIFILNGSKFDDHLDHRSLSFIFLRAESLIQILKLNNFTRNYFLVFSLPVQLTTKMSTDHVAWNFLRPNKLSAKQQVERQVKFSLCSGPKGCLLGTNAADAGEKSLFNFDRRLKNARIQCAYTQSDPPHQTEWPEQLLQ